MNSTIKCPYTNSIKEYIPWLIFLSVKSIPKFKELGGHCATSHWASCSIWHEMCQVDLFGKEKEAIFSNLRVKIIK